MITITTPKTAKLTFKGTTTEIKSVICRLEFNSPMDGKTIQVALYPFGSKVDYQECKSLISIEGVEGFTTAAKVYDLLNEDGTFKAQSIKVAHDEVKAYLDGLGYLTTITGI